MQDKEALQQISRDLSRLQNALSGPGGVSRQLEGQLRQLENRLLRQFEQTMLAQLQTLLPAGLAQAVPILGRLLPGMADGGVLDGSQPAVLAGEAGPEAVLPLRRGPDGQLGVAQIGGPAFPPAVPAADPVTERPPVQFGNQIGEPDSLAPSALQAPRISIHLHMEQPAGFVAPSLASPPISAGAGLAPLPVAAPAAPVWQADSSLFADHEQIAAPPAEAWPLDPAPLDPAPLNPPAASQPAPDLLPPELEETEILTRLELDQLSGMLRRALEQAVDHRLEEGLVQLRGQWGGYL